MFPLLLAYMKDNLAPGARGAAPACRACTSPVWLAWRFRPTPVMPARLKLCQYASRNARAMRPACCLFALRTAPQFRPGVGEIARRWTHLSLCCASLARGRARALNSGFDRRRVAAEMDPGQTGSASTMRDTGPESALRLRGLRWPRARSSSQWAAGMGLLERRFRITRTAPRPGVSPDDLVEWCCVEE